MKNELKKLGWLGVVVGFCLYAQEIKPLHETVSVVNVEIPFRVIMDKTLVGGMKKEEFRLMVNGQERPINGFFEIRKKIAADSRPAGGPGRLFLLLFNITNYRLDIDSGIGHFFDKILRTGDRLLVVTNSFFLTDRVIEDAAAEKEKVLSLLDLEVKKIRNLRLTLRNRLAALLRDTADLSVNSYDPESPKRYFIENYLSYLKEFRAEYLSLTAEQYVSLARYLQDQDAEKWVVNFFELNSFYQPVLNSHLDKYLQDCSLYLDLKRELSVSDQKAGEVWGSYFINTGAMVHTIYLFNKDVNPVSASDSDFWKLEDQAIALETESVLVEMAKRTGGLIMETNKMEQFFDRMSTIEDIQYVMTFIPTAEEMKKRDVMIQSTRKGVKVIHDDQKKSLWVQAAIGKKNSEVKSSLKLVDVRCQNGIVQFSVDGPQVYSKEAGASPSVLLRMRILDEKLKPIHDRSKKFPLKSGELIQIRLPNLEKGDYDIVLDVWMPGELYRDAQVISVRL